MEKKKAVAPLFISRLNLYNTLTKQYGGVNPFVIQKDGKDVYSFKNDRLTFTCCNKTDHKHHMSPLQMLQLVYIYGYKNPCPICNKYGEVNNKGFSSLGGQEEGSDMDIRKKYIETDDPVENAKRESLIEAENNNRNHVHEESYHKKKDDDEIAESVSYDDYIKENPDYKPEIKNTPEEVEDEIIEAEYVDDDIVESVSYDDYIVKNPEFANKIVGDERFNERPKNRYDDEYLFGLGQEEGSIFAHNDQERSVQNSKSDHVKEEHPGHTNIIKNNAVPEIKEEIKMDEIPDNPYDDMLDDIDETVENVNNNEEEIDRVVNSEIEKSNVENTNILSNESDIPDLNSSNYLDDDEEEFDI